MAEEHKSSIDANGVYKLTAGGDTRITSCSLIKQVLANHPGKRALVVLPTDNIVHAFRQSLKSLDLNFGDLGDKAAVQTATIAKISNRIDRLNSNDYCIVFIDELFPSQAKHVSAIVEKFSEDCAIVMATNYAADTGYTLEKEDVTFASPHP